ncbi:hypothetical protein MHBO_002330, partial [Bonamia ostreae]
ENLNKKSKKWSKTIKIALKLSNLKKKQNSRQFLEDNYKKFQNVAAPVFWWTAKDGIMFILNVLDKGLTKFDQIFKHFDFSDKFVLLKNNFESHPRELIQVNNIQCRCKKGEVKFSIRNLAKCALCKKWMHIGCFRFYSFNDGAICSNCKLPIPPKKILLEYLDKILTILDISEKEEKTENFEDVIKKENNFDEQKIFLENKFIKNINNIIKFGVKDYSKTSKTTKKLLRTSLEIFLKEEKKYLEEHKNESSAKRNFLKLSEFENLKCCDNFSGDKAIIFCSICNEWRHSDCSPNPATFCYKIENCSECSNLSDNETLFRRKSSIFKLKNKWQFFCDKILNKNGERPKSKNPMNESSDELETCQLLLVQLKMKIQNLAKPKNLANGEKAELKYFAKKMAGIDRIARNLSAYPTPNHFAEDIRTILRELWLNFNENLAIRSKIEKTKKEFEKSFSRTVPKHRAGPNRSDQDDFEEESDVTTAQSPKLSSKMATKIIERVRLFDKIRFCLSLDTNTLRIKAASAALKPLDKNDKNKLFESPENRDNDNLNSESSSYEIRMPKWWDPPLHDVLVMFGLERNGFGEVLAIITDPFFRPALLSFEGIVDE